MVPRGDGSRSRARLPASTWAWPLGLIAVGLVISYLLATVQHRAALAGRRDQVRAALGPVRDALSRETFAAVYLTEGIAATVAIDGGIEAERFERLSAELLRRDRLVRNIALAPDNVVRDVFPRAGNERAIGLDYRTNPDQWPSVARMMARRGHVVAGPVELVQGGVGLIGRSPIYLPGAGAGEERYWGLTSTVIDFEALLARAPLAPLGVQLRIVLRGVDGLGARGAPFWGDRTVLDDGPVELEGPLPSGSWVIAAVPRGGWPPLRPWRSTYALTSAALSLVLAGFLRQVLRLIALQRRATDALREREQRLSTIYDTVADVIFHLAIEPDGRFRFVAVNKAFGRVTGLPDDAIVGRLVDEVIPPASLPKVLAGYRRACAGPGIVRWEETSDYPAGSLIGEVTVAPVLGPDGRCEALVGTVHDITARTRGEQALRELNDSLERKVDERTRALADARTRAEAADRLKSAFLATMSHELRTPLNSILGFTGIVLQGLAGPLNDEQRRQLTMVRTSARHLLELINDVLDISKIEAGQLELRPARFELQAAVDRVVAMIAPLAEKKGLAVRVVVPAEPGAAHTDQRRVEQVLLNLLNNAVKFTEHGEVRLTLSLADGWARIEVADTGVGIRADQLSELFQPFRQLDTGLQRQHEGTGLGLAICQRLVERLGGTIGVDSEVGRGSVFWVRLPLELPPS